MKHSQLKSIAHSLAASLASGCSLMTGVYDLDIYDDAGRSPGNELIVDLLNGVVVAGAASPQVSAAVVQLPPNFRRLCAAADVACCDGVGATARFYVTAVHAGFHLVVADSDGRVTETEYEGTQARRALELDAKGKIRCRAIRRL
jgi:hypothetical protein